MCAKNLPCGLVIGVKFCDFLTSTTQFSCGYSHTFVEMFFFFEKTALAGLYAFSR